MKEKPYIRREEVIVHQGWNPKFDQDANCVCGHPYYRHFDSYENNKPVGCKYCDCHYWSETIEEWQKNNGVEYFIPIEDFDLRGKNYSVSVISLEEFENKVTDNSPNFEFGYPTKDGKVCPQILIQSHAKHNDPIPFEHDGYLWFVSKGE